MPFPSRLYKPPHKAYDTPLRAGQEEIVFRGQAAWRDIPVLPQAEAAPVKTWRVIVEVLLDKIVYLHRSDSKTNVSIAIPVPRDFTALEFLCTYEPKKMNDEVEARRQLEVGLEAYIPAAYREEVARRYSARNSLDNLITLSLDYNDEYIGCAHRQAAEQRHIISADSASNGFIKHAAVTGNWRAVLNVHVVVSAEARYHLKVIGHDSLQML
jgi:hypothetical protein